MRLEKMGLIFDPHSVGSPDQPLSFAQAPQVLALEDGLRLYFSHRVADPDGGKPRSHIGYVEMDGDLRQIRHCVDRAVPLGGLGCFDEHGIFPMAILRRGDEIWGYITGWSRRVSVSVETAIGLVVSRDGGASFERPFDGPILGPSLHEPFLVGDGFVIEAEGRFHMWYIFGVRWAREYDGAEPDRVYKIGHAVSEDGVAWRRESGRRIIPDVLGPDECQALPSVVAYGGIYHMAFCYRHMHGFRADPDRGYRIGYAWSDDLTHWRRDDAGLNLTGDPGAWDGDMQCYPHLFVHRERLMLLYNGNAFGKRGFGCAVITP